MIDTISHFITDLLLKTHISNAFAESLTDFLMLVLAIFLAFVLDKAIHKVSHSILTRASRKTKSNWDDILLENKFFKRLFHIAPVFIFLSISDKLFLHATQWNEIITGATQIYIVILAILIINSFLKSMNDIYMTYEGSYSRPIKGYIQTVQIIIISFAIILIISILLGRSPIIILGGLGAFAAVLMLIFRDSILGFVAGIQISFNDMVRIGDWVTIPKYGADGLVIDIALTTVKIQNWDKTISTVPAYSMISESFQNWRGMEESGGRRIKRSIFIDMNSIKFCDEAMLKRFSKIHLIKEYIESKEAELKKHNEDFQIDSTIPVNGRRQTNIGVFRAYLNEFLKSKSEIHDGMTFLVRQLQPTEKGLPLEIYVFSRIKEWSAYENLQADIFDHIFSVISHFDLSIFQNPSGKDFREKFNINP